jgi:hypothetical protein
MTGADNSGGPLRPSKNSKAVAKARREERLAEALRANLKRRKAAGGKKPAGAAADPKKP